MSALSEMEPRVMLSDYVFVKFLSITADLGRVCMCVKPSGCDVKAL